MKIKLTESKLKKIVAESVKKALNESYGYDSYPQTGYEECSRIGERYAYKAFNDLLSTYDQQEIDGECIDKIANSFSFRLWNLAEHGQYDEYTNKFHNALGVSQDQYNKDVESGKYLR